MSGNRNQRPQLGVPEHMVAAQDPVRVSWAIADRCAMVFTAARLTQLPDDHGYLTQCRTGRRFTPDPGQLGMRRSGDLGTLVKQRVSGHDASFDPGQRCRAAPLLDPT